MEDPSGAKDQKTGGAGDESQDEGEGKQSKEKGELKYSQEQVDKLIKDKVNEAKGQITWTQGEIEKREKVVKEAEAKQKETQREIDVWQVAQEKKVDATALKEKLAELGIDNKDKFPKVAELMKSGFKPDSMRSAASKESIEGMTASQKLKKGFEKLNT